MTVKTGPNKVSHGSINVYVKILASGSKLTRPENDPQCLDLSNVSELRDQYLEIFLKPFSFMLSDNFSEFEAEKN